MSAYGDGPLDGDGDVAGGGDGAEEQRGLDGVVVGDGDEAGELEEVLDLGALEVEGEARGEGRGPVAAGVVGADAGVVEGTGFEPAHDGLEGAPVGGELGDEVEGLLGLAGVGVEGDAGGKALGGVGFAPEIGDAGAAERGGGLVEGVAHGASVFPMY